MNNWIKDLLYNDMDKLRDAIRVINEQDALHIIAANYNWDNGFEIPKLIIDNENCDLGTALLIFYRADGYRILETNDISILPDSEWKEFIFDLYSRIKINDFKSTNISYTPELSKVQLFKLKKNNPHIPSVIVEKSPGKEIDIPNYF